MQKIFYLSALIATLSFPSWSFAGNSNSFIAGSCNNTAIGFCSEFTGSSYKAVNVEKSCTRQKMTFLTGKCPTEGRVGSCLMYKEENNQSYYRYYTNFPGFGINPKGGVTAAAEKQSTQMNGEWVPN